MCWKTFPSPSARGLGGFPEATVGSCPATSHVYLSLHLAQEAFKQAALLSGGNVMAVFWFLTLLEGIALLLHGSELWSCLLSPRWYLAFIPPPQGNDNTPHRNTVRLHSQVFSHPQAHTPTPNLCSLLPPMGWKIGQKTRTWYHTMQRQNSHPKHLSFIKFYRIKRGLMPIYLVSCQERCYLSRGDGDRQGSR